MWDWLVLVQTQGDFDEILVQRDCMVLLILSPSWTKLLLFFLDDITRLFWLVLCFYSCHTLTHSSHSKMNLQTKTCHPYSPLSVCFHLTKSCVFSHHIELCPIPSLHLKPPPLKHHIPFFSTSGLAKLRVLLQMLLPFFCPLLGDRFGIMSPDRYQNVHKHFVLFAILSIF